MGERLNRTSALVGCFAFAIVSRLIFLTSSSSMWDSTSYVLMVQKMVQTRAPVFSTLEFGHPLYVTWCALVCWVFGLGPDLEGVMHGIKLAGVVIFASSVWPFFWTARWLLGDARSAMLTTWIYAVLPLSWWWAGEIMSDATGLAVLIWAFGFLARWLTGGRTGALLAACLVLGASPLVRLSAGGLYPLFGVLVVVGLVRRRMVKPGLALLVIPIPLVIMIAADLLFHPDRAISSYFQSSGMNSVSKPERLFAASTWELVNVMARQALGGVGLVAVGLGLGAALWRRSATPWFALGWIVPAIVFPILATLTIFDIRYLLVTMPACALLIGELLVALRAAPRGIWAARGAAAAIVVCFVIHAWPDLQALHDRTNVLDALPRWYRENTPDDALVLCGHDTNHMRTFAPERESLFLVHPLEENPWYVGLAVDVPGLVSRVDAALHEGRLVVSSGILSIGVMRTVESFYTLTPYGRIEGSEVRNVGDPQFRFFGERLRKPVDLAIYRLARNDRTPRFAPPPEVTFGPDGRLELAVHHAAGAGLNGAAFVTRHANALDAAYPTLQPDALLRASLSSNTVFRLDDAGRARATLKRPEDATGPIRVGYLIMSRANKVLAISGLRAIEDNAPSR